MLTNEEILEIVICGYEQLKMVANEKGISVDDLIELIKSCLNSSIGDNGARPKVRIMEVKEITNLEIENHEENIDKSTRFFPIYKNDRRNVLNMVKIKIR
ncbi:hypothetical protein DRP07_03415 [Archaeoglobales archaeon]|nr:MAG: hypothetical protein DRP07_03415 [Archaeoglobales archaeon]